ARSFDDRPGEDPARRAELRVPPADHARRPAARAVHRARRRAQEGADHAARADARRQRARRADARRHDDPGAPAMKSGERLPELNRRIDMQTLVRYAGASGDFNPIHYDEQYAMHAGLDGVIGHGMLAMALVSEAVTDWVGDSGLVKSISARFTSSYRLG